MTNPYRYNYGWDAMHQYTSLFGATFGDAVKLGDALASKSDTQRAKKLAQLTPILNMTEDSRKFAQDMYK